MERFPKFANYSGREEPVGQPAEGAPVDPLEDAAAAGPDFCSAELELIDRRAQQVWVPVTVATTLVYFAGQLVGAFLGAFVAGIDRFEGRSSLKTWVFAILKNRIIDHLRQAGRTVPMSSLVDEGEDWQERLEALFNERGGWRDSARPTPWPRCRAST